jgi:integrase
MRQKAVAVLSTAELRRWRDALGKELAASTVNRLTTILKAVLNHAADQDERLTNRRVWEIGLATIANADESRNVILSEPTVRQIILKAREISTEFGLLVEVAAVTGARVSQLARIEVQDLFTAEGAAKVSVPVSKKGKGAKAVPRRTVPIGSALAARLRLAVADRPATAPLLVKPGGDNWRKSDHARPFARAVAAAGEDPRAVTMYALRHTSIVRQLLANVPIRIVATLHDDKSMSLDDLDRAWGGYAGCKTRWRSRRKGKKGWPTIKPRGQRRSLAGPLSGVDKLSVGMPASNKRSRCVSERTSGRRSDTPAVQAPMTKPRFFKSSSSSRQSCALSRAPSVKPSSSFLPSGVAPMMTRIHCLASSRRACR